VPLIQATGLTKLYRMGDAIVRALDGVDLEIEEGEFVAITGASGSGKSTMMHLLGCLDRPTAGTYLFNGRNVGEMSDRELARIRNKSVGFVFQTFNLINRTSALENVGIPLFYARRANTRMPAKRALERVGLSLRANHTPAELSGGERQRVAIARAIVNDPVLLLADEPTGNLDTRTGQQIMEIFSALNEQGVTIVLVTHEREVAMRAKRVVQMRDGKIVSDEPTDKMRAAEEGSPAESPDRALQPEPEPHAAPAASKVASDAAGQPATAAAPAVEAQPRLAAGANGALGCGIAAPVFFALAIIAVALVTRMNVDVTRIGPQNPPPPAFVVLTLAMALCLLLAVVAGFVGVFWGRAVLRRIRSVPGNWMGAGRARAAWICGLVTVLIPMVLLGVQVVACVLRLSRPPGAAS
jgi:putative ABC transport system ATP-binding protein